jgi:hypothetical protein
MFPPCALRDLQGAYLVTDVEQNGVEAKVRSDGQHHANGEVVWSLRLHLRSTRAPLAIFFTGAMDVGEQPALILGRVKVFAKLGRNAPREC